MAAWLSLLLIIILYVVSFVDRHIIALLVEPIKHDLGLSDAQIGLLQGMAFSITYALAGLPIGWLVDRYSRRTIIFCGIVGWSIAAMTTGLSRNFWQMFAARAGVGVGEATLAPAGLSLISDLFPRERLATALSFYTAGSNIGGGLAFMIGGLVVGGLAASPTVEAPLFGTIASWQAVFMIVGAPGLLFAFLVLAIREPRRGARTQGDGPDAASFLRALGQRSGVLAAHWTAFPILALCTYSTSLWVPSWSMRQFGWTAQEIGLLMGFSNGILAVGANLTSGYLTDLAFRHGMRDAHFRIPAITCSIGTAICIFGLVGISSGTAAVWVVILGATIQMAYGGAAFSSLQLVMPPQMRGRATSVYMLILTLVGFGIGPFVVGYLADNLFGNSTGLGKSLALTLGVATCIAVLILLSGRRALRHAFADAEREAATLPASAPCSGPSGRYATH
ncbi:MFS transporter [Sphingobium sp. Sx8-8]|uniref:spinster family MFS transporter n=1 Tax=Sphingobium sp. Sx8-8 TaxID=2933617 RepID=UPI001F5803BD|nr:MFS transporter [Sphingobium sp. Sx8-8]